MNASSYRRPSAVAELLGVRIGSVLAWIRSGELRATNCAERPGGRPRWRVSQEAIDLFLAKRSARPDSRPASARRSRGPVAEVQYF